MLIVRIGSIEFLPLEDADLDSVGFKAPMVKTDAQ
jgi:hypothetical protein